MIHGETLSQKLLEIVTVAIDLRAKVRNKCDLTCLNTKHIGCKIKQFYF